MIRRGLQIILVVGITALGAAPLFAQFAGSPPSTLVISGAPYEHMNRTWYYNGDDGGDHVYYETPDGSGFPLRVNIDFVRAWFQLGVNGEEEHEVFVYPDGTWQDTVAGTSGVASAFSVTWQGGGFGPGFSPGNEYEDNFPDWASAGVKIPLGFGIGMAFWAVMLGFGVPMRWVKELTNAAT